MVGIDFDLKLTTMGLVYYLQILIVIVLNLVYFFLFKKSFHLSQNGSYWVVVVDGVKYYCVCYNAYCRDVCCWVFCCYGLMFTLAVCT